MSPELIPATAEAEHAQVEDGLGGLWQASDARHLEARLAAGAVEGFLSSSCRCLQLDGRVHGALAGRLGMW